MLAEDQARRFSVRVDPVHAVIALGADELAAALDAVLGNVFAHTPEGVAIAVRLTEEDPGLYRLSMEDEGPGLPDLSLLKRGASARNSTGLGLDIARRAAEKRAGGWSWVPVRRLAPWSSCSCPRPPRSGTDENSTGPGRGTGRDRCWLGQRPEPPCPESSCPERSCPERSSLWSSP